MKIVCESCGAKYSIADERVTGKVFKIRCKRCSEVIVVRGDQQAAPAGAAPAAAAAQGQDAIWHVVVDGEQAGPYSPGQLAEMLNSAAVDWDAYVWTEGFDNWAPMRDVADLVALITGQAQPQAAAQAAPAYRPSATQTLSGQPSMGADPFADDAGPSDPGLFGGGGAAPDLFGRGGAQAGGGYGGGADPALATPSPAPRVAPERALTGARNENSVLFSLKNLQALATGSGTPSAPVAASGGGSERGAGFASGEGSGLIDIRALASTTGIGEGAEAPGQKDELLSLGSQGGAFGTLGSPMLAPARDEGDSQKKTLIWAGVIGVGFVCVAGVAVAYLLTQRQQPAPPVSVQPTMLPAPVAAAPAPQAAPTPPAPSEGELAAKAAAAEREKSSPRESEKSSSGSHGSSKKRSSESAGAKSGGSDTSGEPLLEPRKEPPKSSGPRTIDDLLDGALSGTSKPTKKADSADDSAKSNLPTTPSRDDVLSAMNGVKPAVQACAKGAGGVATVSVNVAGATGHVTTAEVNGVSGPAGSCIAQAVRKAQFAKFQQKVFKVTFPYKL
ncbi:MAG: GYF domain-containing protein [Polyangiales bacterium]